MTFLLVVPCRRAAALEASRALERRYAEVAEERQALSTAFEAEKVG